MSEYMTLLAYLAGPAIVGLIVWVWLLWKSHMDYKVYVADNYVQKADTAQTDTKMAKIEHTLEEILKIVYELKGASGKT